MEHNYTPLIILSCFLFAIYTPLLVYKCCTRPKIKIGRKNSVTKVNTIPDDESVEICPEDLDPINVKVKV